LCGVRRAKGGKKNFEKRARGKGAFCGNTKPRKAPARILGVERKKRLALEKTRAGKTAGRGGLWPGVRFTRGEPRSYPKKTLRKSVRSCLASKESASAKKNERSQNEI